jgi:type I restriction enzyme S subunit
MSNKAVDKNMTQATKRELKPRLRFPEFRDAGEWELKELEQICDINPSNTGLPDTFVYIDLESVEAGELKTKKKICRDNAPSRAQRVLQYGDVIYQIVRPYQKNNFFFAFDDGDNYVASTGYAQLRACDSKEFLYQIIHTDDFVGRVIAKCTGSNYPAINSSDLAKIHVAIPRHKEQQKIADCLSSLDELISAQTQKLDTLKTHKKGLMQQLFPLDGETVPRLRFPEFRDAGEWEEKPIGGVCKTFSGGTPSTSEKSFYGGKTPFIRSAEIDKNQTELFLTDEGLANSSAKLVRKGDVLVALYGANSGEVALSKLDGAINQAILCLQSRSNNPFIYQYLCLKKDWIVATYIQGGQGNLSGEIIKSIKLNFPSPEEQKSVADCLSSLDELISAQTQKLTTLKTHKKGLMQQLFPALDEMTT